MPPPPAKAATVHPIRPGAPAAEDKEEEPLAPEPEGVPKGYVAHHLFLAAYANRKRPAAKNGSQLCVVLSSDANFLLNEIRNEIQKKHNDALNDYFKYLKKREALGKITKNPPTIKVTQQEVVAYALNKFFVSCGKQPEMDVPDFLKDA